MTLLVGEISLPNLSLEAGVEYGCKHVYGLCDRASTRVYVGTDDLERPSAPRHHFQRDLHQYLWKSKFRVSRNG